MKRNYTRYVAKSLLSPLGLNIMGMILMSKPYCPFSSEHGELCFMVIRIMICFISVLFRKSIFSIQSMSC